MRVRTLFVALVLPVLGAGSGPADLSAQSGSAPFELTRLHSIGCAACSGPALLSNVTDLAVLSDGGVVLIDGSAPFLRAFGPDGDPAFQAVREGEGPGEAPSISALAALSGRRTATLDLRLQRITFVGPGGELVETKPLDAFPLGMHGAPDGSGFWLIQTDFRTGATFSYWDAATLEPTPATPDLAGMGFEESELPFEFFAVAAATGARLAVGAGEYAYRIRVVGPDGSRLYEASRDIPRLPKSPETIEEERARRTASLGRLMGRAGGATGNPEAGALSREVEIDPFYRHFLVHDLDFDGADRLWVRTPRGGPERTVFDVFDAAGGYLGEVAIPGRVSRFSVGHGYLAAVTLDELDVQKVEVWRVRRPGGASGRDVIPRPTRRPGR